MPEKEQKPQIRFKGFTDAWEQRKLGDLGSVAMNKRIFKEQTTESGDVPFYKIGTFVGCIKLNGEDSGEGYVFETKCLIDPEKPEDIYYGELIRKE